MTTVAVALAEIEAVHRTGTMYLRTPKSRTKVKLQKFFGKCLMPDGKTTILVAKALNEQDASKKLHKGYKIDVVLDILTEADMPKEWAKIKPSLIQRSQLK